LSLARTYRNWSGRELAEEMGRDPHNVVPSSGVPRPDLVLRLAEALEWTPQDVIEELCRVDDAPRGAGPAGETYDDLDRRAFELQQECRFAELVQVAQRMLASAESGTQRANAKLREFIGWDGLGRYSLALAAVQSGLREREVSAGVSLTLKTNLAHCHYALGNLDEASALASALISTLQKRGPGSGYFFEGSLGYLFYVRGSCSRILSTSDPVERASHVAHARADLAAAKALLSSAGEEHRVAAYLAIAKACEGALLELAALAGEVPAEIALRHVLDALSSALDPAGGIERGLLEAWGWWCIFGCNIALSHRLPAEVVERSMAFLTNKADEVASHLGNWLLRERVWSMELQRRERVASCIQADRHPILDADDTRTIIGTMARFPAFRAVGWSILDSSNAI
jgi:hypothetical protein